MNSFVPYHDKKIHAKMILQRLNSAMLLLENKDWKNIVWFYCFGTMLEYIADLNFGLDYDIDIGVIYGEADADSIIRSMIAHGYEFKKKIINDVTKQVLNLQFKPSPNDSIIKGTPDIDIYFWYEHEGFLYHTYDYHKEGKDIPSQYVFKGVPKEWILPSKSMVDFVRGRGNTPLNERMMTEKGVWNYELSENHEAYQFKVPFAYGKLLDEWYPGWRFREYYRGQSMSKYEVRMKSCSRWAKGNIKHELSENR